jgi:TetR/AcrR family transcriptional regulator
MFAKFLNLDQERRDAILNAALKEFARKGFDKASTNVIAREAGISKPLLFHYVKNKRDFFLFLYDYCLELLEREYFSQIDLEEKDIFERLYWAQRGRENHHHSHSFGPASKERR